MTQKLTLSQAMDRLQNAAVTAEEARQRYYDAGTRTANSTARANNAALADLDAARQAIRDLFAAKEEAP